MTPFQTSKLIPNFSFAVMRELEQTVTEQVAELKPDLPSFTKCNCQVGVDDAVCIVAIEFKEGGMTSCGEMNPDEFLQLKSIIGRKRRFRELNLIGGLQAYFDWNRIVLASDVENGTINWSLILGDLVDWANVHPLPRARLINERRVRLAIPNPPQFSLASVQSAMWVIECEDQCTQGTGFDLIGYGTVTNAHVVEGTTRLRAFRAGNPTEKFKVFVEKINQALDLAIVTVEGGQPAAGLPASNHEMKQMDHIAVCGFPNYRLGDSGVLSPGIVVGTRMKSGVQRLLTNAGIVAGMSGGPALREGDQVVGVCATGSDNFQNTRETEDQSIIPVGALDLL